MNSSAVAPTARPVGSSSGSDAKRAGTLASMTPPRTRSRTSCASPTTSSATRARRRGARTRSDDRDREQELEHPAVGDDPGEHRRQHVVDDERDRVWQVEEVGERPDPALHQSRRAARRCLDERGQSPWRDDPPGVDEPDRERRREHRERERTTRPADSIPSSPAAAGRKFASAIGPPIEAIAKPTKSRGEKPPAERLSAVAPPAAGSAATSTSTRRRREADFRPQMQSGRACCCD